MSNSGYRLPAVRESLGQDCPGTLAWKCHGTLAKIALKAPQKLVSCDIVTVADAAIFFRLQLSLV